jgi:hypothetical protein
MSNWRRFMLAAYCAVSIVGARAEIVPDLYTVGVPVADQSASELQRAASAGLREIAVRISGRSDAERQSRLAAAFPDAQRLLSQYRYERNGDGWSAQLKFAPESIERLLRGAGLPVWGADRPVLRAWLVLDDGQSARFINDASPLAAAVRAQAQRRGVVVQLPENVPGVAVDDVARLDVAKVQTAIGGRTPVLLIGRIEQAGTAFSGGWLLAANGQQFTAENRSDTANGLLAANFDRLIDQLSPQYAATAEGGDGVMMQVNGIATFDDYAALLNYLQRIALIKRASPVLVRNDEVLLQLKLQGTSEQLARQLALETKLVPENKLAVDTQSIGDPAASGTLSYRWSAPK